MKSNLSIILVLLTTACSNHPVISPSDMQVENIEVPAKRDSQWYSCETDSDCVVVDDMNCTLASVNRRHVAEFQLWARYGLDQVHTGVCEGKTRNDINYLPVCREGTCSSKPK